MLPELGVADAAVDQTNLDLVRQKVAGRGLAPADQQVELLKAGPHVAVESEGQNLLQECRCPAGRVRLESLQQPPPGQQALSRPGALHDGQCAGVGVDAQHEHVIQLCRELLLR